MSGNGFDESMGGEQQTSADPRTTREQIEAMIPALHMFDVVLEQWNANQTKTEQKTISVIAHSMAHDAGKVLFFQQRFEAPNRLMSYTTRIIGGTILDAEDKGEVPTSRILH